MVWPHFLCHLHLGNLLTCILLIHLDGVLSLCALNDPGDLDVVDVTQQGTLSLHLALGEIEFGDGSCQAVCTISDADVALGRPWMLETVVDTYPLLDVDCEHTVDEVKRRVADRVPVRRRIVEATSLDLL
jgi:hypothetical protein